MRRGKERTGEEKGEGWGLDGRGGERRGGKKGKEIRWILKQLLKDNLPLESGITEGICNQRPLFEPLACSVRGSW